MINRNESFVEKESQWYRYRLSYSNVEKCKLHLAPGGGGALPYMAYTGTCRWIGYGFWPLLS